VINPQVKLTSRVYKNNNNKNKNNLNLQKQNNQAPNKRIRNSRNHLLKRKKKFKGNQILKKLQSKVKKVPFSYVNLLLIFRSSIQLY